MRDSLRIRRDPIVLFAGQEDESRVQTRENPNAEVDTLLGGAVLDHHKRLACWVHRGTVQGMTRDDFDITGQILIKRSQLRGFTGSLSTDYGANLGGRAILGDDFLNELSFDTVDDPVACS
jgi:hypothetical protein